MMDVAASAVMATKDCADHGTSGRCDETHPGIPVQVGLDARWRICLAQTDALALLPQGKYAIVGIHCERMDLDDRRAVIEHGVDFGRLYFLAVDLLVFEDGIRRSSHSDPDHRATASVRS